jgi:hypothetical protein
MGMFLSLTKKDDPRVKKATKEYNLSGVNF